MKNGKEEKKISKITSDLAYQFMQSLFGDVIKQLIILGFEKEDIFKYTTIGTIANLYKYNHDQIIKIIKREINDQKREKGI